MKKIKVYDGIVIDMSTSEVISHGEVSYVDASDVAQFGFGGGGGQTTTTSGGFAEEFKPQFEKLFNTGIGLYDQGKLGRVADFNEVQGSAQQAGAIAAGNQTNLENQISSNAQQGIDLGSIRTAGQRQDRLERDMIGGANTYNRGLEKRAMWDAQKSLGGLNAAAGNTGNLGGSRQALSQRGLQNDLGASLAGLRAQGAQQNYQNLGTAHQMQGAGASNLYSAQAAEAQRRQGNLGGALSAQGTGANSLAKIGDARQLQTQRQVDAPYSGWAQLLGPLTGIAGQQSQSTTTGGGK